MRIIITSLLIIFAAHFCKAQNILEKRTYRIIGYKAGDNRIYSISNYAEVKAPQRFYIPNAFTPNGDGMNDTFGIKGEGLEDFKLVIFNRWGEEIFQSENPKDQWDGKYKGQAVQQDVYTYQLFCKGNAATPRSGSVTLLR